MNTPCVCCVQEATHHGSDGHARCELHRLSGDARTIGETLLIAPLNEIRDLLAARLPVPVEVSEVERLRKENADLRAELDALKAADKPGRWVLFNPKAQHCQYRDRDGWFDTEDKCRHPWSTKDGALGVLVPGAPGYHEWSAINLDDHKETP